MNIGDKVRFLNDVGGGRITAIRPGGIVLVEDEDGFDMPVLQSEVVVIEENAPKVEKKPAPKVQYGTAPAKGQAPKEEGLAQKEQQEAASLNGKEYLLSKTVKTDEEEEVDEQLEARVVRLEIAVQQLEARIARLEAENNLRKNEKMLRRPAKWSKPTPPDPSIEKLEIL